MFSNYGSTIRGINYQLLLIINATAKSAELHNKHRAQGEDSFPCTKFLGAGTAVSVSSWNVGCTSQESWFDCRRMSVFSKAFTQTLALIHLRMHPAGTAGSFPWRQADGA